MSIKEIERQMAGQHSIMQAFPSQTPSLEQSFSGENQRAIIKMQIETAKLSANHDKKLEKINEALISLLQLAEQQQVASQQKEKLEEQRYKEIARLSRIAALAGVASIVVAVILTAIGIWVQIALK